MSERAAALVIGAGIGGLVASAYLGRGGVHTLLLEARSEPREPAEALVALDARVISELRLLSRGLSFAHRDLPLAVSGEMPLLLSRDLHAASAALSKFSDADALTWPRYRRTLMAEARKLRRWWWTMPEEERPDLGWSTGARRAFQRLCLSGADAYLAARFETPALLAALLWDAGAGGFSVNEPGSALALVWRAAQEMEGRQAATAIARPGSLVAALRDAQAMAQFRPSARVTQILTRAGGVTGVALADGSEIEADHVISTLSRARTLRLAGLPQTEARIGEAQILLRLRPGFRAPAMPAARHILVSRPDAHLDAHEAARGGRIAANLPMEWVMLAPDLIAVTARPVPAPLKTQGRAQVAAQAVMALSRTLPGVAEALAGVEIHLRPGRASLADLLAPPLSRIVTPIKGLLLAGESAEPLPAISGRAARVAARLVLSH
jgi:phytoene dehydrogenase-like protein